MNDVLIKDNKKQINCVRIILAQISFDISTSSLLPEIQQIDCESSVFSICMFQSNFQLSLH